MNLSTTFRRVADVVEEKWWMWRSGAYSHLRSRVSDRENSVEHSTSALRVSWPTTYGWPPGEKWFRSIVPGLQQLTEFASVPIPQPDGPIVLFHVEENAQGSSNTQGRLKCAIDYSDYESIDEKIVENVDLYFKMQFRNAGYDRAHVVPGGFPSNDPLVEKLAPLLRGTQRINGREIGVYGRYGAGFAFETRARCFEILASTPGANVVGGFQPVRYTRFLREAAAAKICIDLPGNGPLCFRLVDYLALGCFVIAHPHAARLPVPLRDKEHLVYMTSDMSNLSELVRYYLDRPDEREKIRENAANYFDRHLRGSALAAYYLDRAKAHLRERRNENQRFS